MILFFDDNCTQNRFFGRYMYLRLFDFGQNIYLTAMRFHTAPNNSFEYVYPQSKVISKLSVTSSTFLQDTL